MSGPAKADGFVRDGTTVLSYGAFGAIAFWLYAFGPGLALLRSELHFSYATVGAYSAVFAAGSAAVGMSFAWACRAFGRRPLFWWSAVGAICGAALFALTRSVGSTLAGAAVLGFAGSVVGAATQSVLSDRHDSQRDRALVEANIGAGACAVAAPLALGILQATPATWRTGMALPVVVLAALYLAYRRQPLPEPPARPDGEERFSRLPAACWLLALLVATTSAMEFCIIYFGAEMLASTSGLATTTAATAMAAFYAGILASRAGAGVLMGSYRNSTALIWISLAVTTIGVAFFWFSGLAIIAVPGLFVAGAGIANLYPLSLAMTLAAAPGRTDAANARSLLLCGLTVIAAPFILGVLADHIGLSAAFGVVPLLIVISALLLLWARVSSTRAPEGISVAP